MSVIDYSRLRRHTGIALVLALIGGGLQAQGPITVAPNLSVKANNGALLVQSLALAGTVGPLTTFGNIGLKAYNGALAVMIAGGSITPDTICIDATNQDACLGRPSTAMIGVQTGAAVLTPAASVAVGGTVNDTGDFTRQRYQITISPAAGDCLTGFKSAGLTADCTIATLPAGMKLVGAYADVTAGFTCSATCSGTKVFTMGISAGGTEIFAASLNVAATGQFGLADANMGSAMTRAAQIQGGYIPSWSATTAIIARFTSGTGNWGNATVTFVNAGTIKFTLVTEQVK